MIQLNILLKVKDSADVAEIRALLGEQARLSRAEPGCLRFEAYQSQNDPLFFILNEQWESQAAIEAHRKATAYTTIYQPRVLPRVDRTPHPCDVIE